MATGTQSRALGIRGQRDVRIGTVVSDSRRKTIKVREDWVYRHLQYEKYLRRSTVLHAHDENDEAKAGDVVEVVACRRLSKTKCWRLARVVRRGAGHETV